MNGGSDKTARNYTCTEHSLVKVCGDLPIEIFTKDQILRWKMYCDSIGIAVSTIYHDLARVRRVLKYLRKNGVQCLDEEHITLPKLKEKKYTWLNYEEIEGLLSVINSRRDKAIVACLWSTGCRISELLNLNRDDVETDEIRIIGKGDVQGTVYLDPEARRYLNAYLIERRDDLRPLFISSQRRRISYTTFAKLLHEYTDKAGIDKNVTPHVLRHSFATDLKMNGADIFDIQKQLRHKRISSTQIYTHISDKQKLQTYRKYHSSGD